MEINALINQYQAMLHQQNAEHTRLFYLDHKESADRRALRNLEALTSQRRGMIYELEAAQSPGQMQGLIAICQAADAYLSERIQKEIRRQQNLVKTRGSAMKLAHSKIRQDTDEQLRIQLQAMLVDLRALLEQANA